MARKSPPPNFNHLAPIYRWLEYLTFGPTLQRCRTHFLPQLTHCQNALVLGDGDGRFTAALLQANPTIHITAVDASPSMLRTLKQASATHGDRLTTHIADLRVWTPYMANTAPYDLVATHFFLDCLSTEEIAALVSRLAPSLAPSALWLVSEFAIPPTLFGRLVAAPLVSLLYRAFQLLTGLRQRKLPTHSQVLADARWFCSARQTHLRGLLVSEIWQHIS